MVGQWHSDMYTVYAYKTYRRELYIIVVLYAVIHYWQYHQRWKIVSYVASQYTAQYQLEVAGSQMGFISGLAIAQ